MKSIRRIALLLCLSCLLLLASAHAEVTITFTQPLRYQLLEDGTAVITDYLGEPESIDIPAQIDGIDVSWIGPWVFSFNNHLRHVTIAEGVKGIGTGAFAFCYALETVSLPDSVTMIEKNAFQCSPLLNSVRFPSGLTAIASGTFYRCESLQTLTLPSTLTSIGALAFAETGINYLTLPDSLSILDNGAFSGCADLQIVFLPDQFSQTASSIFPGNTLFSVTPGSQAARALDEQGVGYLSPEAVSRENGFLTVFTDMPHVLAYTGTDAVVTYPESLGGFPVTEVPDRLFAGVETLEEIILPPSVTTLGDQAFANCVSLKRAQLPGVTTIGNDCFFECVSLVSVSMPSVQFIGDRGFADCVALPAIELPSGLETIGDYAFANAWQIKALALPDTLRTVGTAAFENCVKLERIELPAQLTTIELGTFHLCARLLLVTLPPTLENVMPMAFEGCSDRLVFIVDQGSSADINLPAEFARVYQPIRIAQNGLYAISEEGCSYIRYLGYDEAIASVRPEIWGYKVTSVDDYAFAGCDNLTVQIPSNIRHIGSEAFSDSKSMRVETEQDTYAVQYCRDNGVRYIFPQE